MPSVLLLSEFATASICRGNITSISSYTGANTVNYQSCMSVSFERTGSASVSAALNPGGGYSRKLCNSGR